MSEMTPLVRQLAEQARIAMASEARLQEFAELIVQHCLEHIECEIESAIDQDQRYAAATLQAISLGILDEFDMELSEE